MDFHYVGRRDQSLKIRVVAQNEAQVCALFPKPILFESLVWLSFNILPCQELLQTILLEQEKSSS